MIKVYFESNSHAECVAIFNTKETYNLCLPALEKEAKKHRMIVTESVEGEDQKDKKQKLLKRLDEVWEACHRFLRGYHSPDGVLETIREAQIYIRKF